MMRQRNLTCPGCHRLVPGVFPNGDTTKPLVVGTHNAPFKKGDDPAKNFQCTGVGRSELVLETARK